MLDHGSQVIRTHNPERPPRAAVPMADAGTQVHVSRGHTSLSTLPTEILQEIMGHLVHDATAPGADEATRNAPASLAHANRRMHQALYPQLLPAQVAIRINLANSPNDIDMLLGTPQQPGPLRQHLTPAQYEQALVQLLAHVDNERFRAMGNTPVALLLDAVSHLPHAAQARVLTEGLRHARAPLHLARLLGSASAHAGPSYNTGTVRALPPHLQTGPLTAAVDYGSQPDFGPLTETVRREIGEAVNALPQGIGEDLKARVADF